MTNDDKFYLLLDDYDISLTTDYLLPMLDNRYSYYANSIADIYTATPLCKLEVSNKNKVFDTKLEYIDNKPYLVLVFGTKPKGIHMELKFHDLFVDDEVINDFYVYKFVVPEKFHKDVERFKEGQYSKFSEELKDLIRSNKTHYMSNGNLNPHLHVINKSEEYRKILSRFLGAYVPEDAELRSKPDMDQQMFDQSVLENYENLNYNLV